MKKSIDDLSGEPVLIPPKIFTRIVIALKNLRAIYANNIESGYENKIKNLLRDLEHCQREFVQK